MRKEYDFKKGKRGAVLAAPAGKTRITIRLDDDILDWFRGQADAAGGGNYQSMINEALRTIATEGPAKIETVVRRVVREELKRVGEHKGAKRAKAAQHAVAALTTPPQGHWCNINEPFVRRARR